MFNLPKRLKEIRENYGMTQNKMAETIGIPLRSYQNYEYGQRNFTAEMLYTLLTKLDISADYFFYRVNNDKHHLPHVGITISQEFVNSLHEIETSVQKVDADMKTMNTQMYDMFAKILENQNQLQKDVVDKKTEQ